MIVYLDSTSYHLHHQFQAPLLELLQLQSQPHIMIARLNSTKLKQLILTMLITALTITSPLDTTMM